MSVSSNSDRRNLLLLIQLRWLAVAGQLATILVVDKVLGIKLPVAAMLCVAAMLALSTAHAYDRYRREVVIGKAELFADLLLDVAVLTVQLYLSGGATNPFVSLYLLHVILGAVLFEPKRSWSLVALTSLCYFSLTFFHRDIAFPHEHPGAFFNLHLHGMFVCFLLAAVLLVAFVNRINENLRNRDAKLEELRRHAAEEENIVRMGLLASGAAHELGTPLSTLSVLLNDWQRMPVLRRNRDLANDILEMQDQVARCKTILSGVLLSAGELRGEGTVRTTLRAFLDETVSEWRRLHQNARLEVVDAFDEDCSIVSDAALKQVVFNLLDNAFEASSTGALLHLGRKGDWLVLSVSDDGPGFQPQILAELGQPYRSTKGQSGSGLGFFLVVNVVRKLGGRVDARNRSAGGACVDVWLPLSSLTPRASR